jgi:hypothetical protein
MIFNHDLDDVGYFGDAAAFNNDEVEVRYELIEPVTNVKAINTLYKITYAEWMSGHLWLGASQQYVKRVVGYNQWDAVEKLRASMNVAIEIIGIENLGEIDVE